MTVNKEFDVIEIQESTRSVTRLAVVGAYAWAGLTLMFASVAFPAVDDSDEKADRPSAGTGMYSTYVDIRTRFFGDELGDTYPISMDDLLPALLVAVHHLSKYPHPDQLPPVHRVPHATIEQLACGRACAALAAYRPGEGIYLDDALKPESSVFARSVLLHELVHYVQDVSNELAAVRPCERWYRREQEAYAIQKRFLALLGSQMRVGYSAGSTCAERSG
jgi:hypothetical protein